MAIDDNTLYGLTGAQVKELPERIEAVKGLARELTTDDYNWPTTGTKTGVALWLLEPGMYLTPSGIVGYLEANVTTNSQSLYMVSQHTNYGTPIVSYYYSSSDREYGNIRTVNSAGLVTQSKLYLAVPVDNLNSTSTGSPLSANQGKVLKGLIDAIVVPTQTSDLTNDGSDGTSTYVEADELATVATSGSYSDLSNTPTIPTVPTNVSAFTNDAGYQTASNVSSAVATETTARQAADANLQSQIDGISASSDVKDIVGTKAALNAYDTSTLGNNDIIKVLQDESQNNETTYYRWSTATSTFTLIGEEGPYYTKSETDTLLNAKANTSSLATVATSGSYVDLTNKPTIPTKTSDLTNDSNFVADASYVHTDNNFTSTEKTKLAGIATGAEVNVNADWNATSGDAQILNKPTIPTVNNATLTIQANGTTVNTFTANASSNVTANIPSATTGRYGVTQLSDSTSSTSTTLAATSSAVKSAYDLAGTKAKITMSSTDPGEGVALAENEYIAVYGGDAMNLDYSTTEKATGGTWIDGKTIYKKTLNTGTLPNATTKTVAHGISGLSRVLKFEGYAYNTNDNESQGLPMVTQDSNYLVAVTADATNLVINAAGDRSMFTESFVTIYYTKSS